MRTVQCARWLQLKSQFYFCFIVRAGTGQVRGGEAKILSYLSSPPEVTGGASGEISQDLHRT